MTERDPLGQDKSKLVKGDAKVRKKRATRLKKDSIYMDEDSQ